MTVRKIKSIGDIPYPIDVGTDALSPLLTAGAALGITGDGPTETAAWLQRTSTSDGPTTAKSIKGNTLVWNQLSNSVWPRTQNVPGLTITVSDNTISAHGTVGSDFRGGRFAISENVVLKRDGRKYLFMANKDLGHDLTLNGYSGVRGRNGFIWSNTAGTDWQGGVQVVANPGDVFDFDGAKGMIFDLTAMFGAGNEPSTVAEFEALYPLPYYEYDAGSLLPVQMEGIETNGFNQWDEVWETGSINTSTGANASSTNTIRSKGYINVTPNTTYFASNGLVVIWYDADKGYVGTNNMIADTGFKATAPSNARYMRFRTGSAYGTTYNHDICINLSDPTRNGTYEPYWHQTRTIPAGTLRSAGTVYDELTETQAVTRIGERAYQSGDESDATVVTDGTVTHYPLASPTTTTIDPPLNLTYRTETGGTERVMVPTGEQSAPPTIVAAQGYTAESLRDAALSAIAPVENGLASTNYAVGSYLVHDGQLCKVTTAIATGEAITIGTNVTTTTVMAEVIALIAQ